MTPLLVLAKQIARRVLPHPIYRIYRKRRVSNQIAGFTPRVVTRSYGGRRLRVLLADPLAEGWYDHDWPRPPEIDALTTVGALTRGATVFDLGAHQGVVALMLAAEVGASGKIVAVEAEPHNAAVAVRNTTLNDASNVTIVHAAVAETPGSVYFAESLNGHVDPTTGFGNVEVPAITIDRLTEQHGHPDAVLVDVEGYEGKALDGARATLESGRTSFLVEVHRDELVECSLDDLLKKFAGYATLAANASASGAAVFESLGNRRPSGRFFLLAVPGETTTAFETHHSARSGRPRLSV
jgi:FkbM family methyltransferase